MNNTYTIELSSNLTDSNQNFDFDTKFVSDPLSIFNSPQIDIEDDINDTHSRAGYDCFEEALTSITKKEPIQSSFIAEQEWEGYVTNIDTSYFHAQLIDLTTKGIEEETKFELAEVSPNNRELLKEGAIFRWSIGYERLKGGTKKRSSSIVFRRLPAWSKREIEKSRKEAELLVSDIIWI